MVAPTRADSQTHGGQVTLRTLECDYLVVGAGASGLAFIDSFLGRLKAAKRNTTILIVDERDQPGGHWNDAYRFARLHHESRHYGISSRKLEKAPRGHYATANECLVYFQSVVEDLVAQGSVQYMPMCSFSFADGVVTSVLNRSDRWKVPDECKIVDTTFLRVQVPSARPPPFEVGVGAFIVPPNFLPTLSVPPTKYVVIGAGRTAIDVILRLLQRGAKADKVQWIVPRDHWYMCREAIDAGAVGKTGITFRNALLEVASQGMRAFAKALEQQGLLCRLDPTKPQEAFHGAAVSQEELHQLRRITDIIRLGRVRAIYEDHMVLEKGVVPLQPGTLHIDCCSNWIQSAEDPVPIFQPNRIVLQPVKEVFVGAGEFNITVSASLIGFLEGLYANQNSKLNAMATPGRYPDTFEDWIRFQLAANNNRNLMSDPLVVSWVTSDRLSLLSALKMPEIRAMFIAGKQFPAEVCPRLRMLLEDKADKADTRKAGTLNEENENEKIENEYEA